MVPEKEEDEEEDPRAFFRQPPDEKWGSLTALHHAAREGAIGAAMALLDGGADIDFVTESDNTSPLTMAVINGRFDLAMKLLERGADPNLATVDGVRRSTPPSTSSGRRGHAIRSRGPTSSRKRSISTSPWRC